MGINRRDTERWEDIPIGGEFKINRQSKITYTKRGHHFYVSNNSGYFFDNWGGDAWLVFTNEPAFKEMDIEWI